MNSGAFYQPLNQDLSISNKQWTQFSSQLNDENIRNVVSQWSRYGNEKFGGNTGWLSKRFEIMMNNGLVLWFGLYSDPDYFKAIHSDIRQQESYLMQYFVIMKDEYQYWQPWLTKNASSIEGLYFPLELSDYDFSTQAQRDQLNNILSSQLQYYQHPIMISLYMSGTISPTEMAEWIQQLINIGLYVFVQDGAGTGSLDDNLRLEYLDFLGCNVGKIVEIFKQKQESNVFAASKLTLDEYRQLRKMKICNTSVLFSLRYLPISNNPLELVN
ncbi:DUF4434 domain-containing protein [Vibrio rumoiensis]|uniref:DUF4434 domain-containing protein n=1 Tax=Vibrio rumoiensis 1S-45 TaxID=1188252 RepID=A0A1E5E086_9VIBR|nr:DUF4434 domain-containing protein [Vibrio rumoiensis]OEF23853.1 hypothetical protein A1QC_11035 [Vibrio rumoiensis 1S-45]